MFTGYSPETVDFLWGIRLNNNREWFMANKSNYTKFLYEPTKELGKALFQPFLDRTGDILKVSRIYRDARMHHPLPYKESLWICIRKDVEWWADNPCLYFEINPEGVHYGCFFWHPKPQKMEEFRREIARDPETFLSLIDQVEKVTGVTVTAEEYKRPKPCDDPRLERFYRWKSGIACTVHEDFSEATFGPALGDRVREFLVKAMPLMEYLERFGG